jgi:hypothetical protein
MFFYIVTLQYKIILPQYSFENNQIPEESNVYRKWDKCLFDSGRSRIFYANVFSINIQTLRVLHAISKLNK